jgi:hypothetical protein
MSHYAKVINGIVQQVIVAEADFFKTFVDTTPGEWIQTSYNSRGNVHYLPNSNTPSGEPALRGNYAGVGFIYNKQNDVFYAPQPFNSWELNKNTWLWEAPIPYPTDNKLYSWDEATKTWAVL